MPGNHIVNFPRYAKLALVLLSTALIMVVLYLGQGILFPIFLSFFFAILLQPVMHWLVKHKISTLPAVTITVVLFCVVVGSLIFFVSWQVAEMADDWNKIKLHLGTHLDNLQDWIKRVFHVSYNKQQTYLERVTNGTLDVNNKMVGDTLNSFTYTLLNITLIPVYIFLILLYRDLFMEFLIQVNGRNDPAKLRKVLYHVKIVIQSYLVGLLIETAIIGVITTLGLAFLGIPYAMLLGAITAILNVIPYIGILVATIISVVVTLANSGELSVIAGLVIMNVVIQLIDNNIIVPRIVGNKVQINGMASMVGVIVGGTLGGVPGMFLSIPIIAIAKVIFDNVDSLKPLGLLLGTFVPEPRLTRITRQKTQQETATVQDP